MPIGVLVNCSAVFIGGLLGCVFGSRLARHTQEYLTVIFGFCSMSIGICSVVKVNALAPVILAVVLGSLIGEVGGLEKKLTVIAGRAVRLLPAREGFDMERFITVVVLFCASGMGIYGVLLSSMNGDHSILLSKAVLDCATAMIFAITLGPAVAGVSLPMLAVMLTLFLFGGLLKPFVTPEMLRDFMSCGGILTIAAGLRVSGIKNSLIANMIPALILVMPFSALWSLMPF